MNNIVCKIVVASIAIVGVTLSGCAVASAIDVSDEDPYRCTSVNETWTAADKTMYVTPRIGLNVRTGPSTDYDKITALPYTTEVHIIATSDEYDWYQIAIDDIIGYIANQYVSDTKPIVITTTTTITSSNPLTKAKGAVYYNGHRETWYSQKVLPGNGLNIPGRHVNNTGLICDKNGYICVASSDLKKGTIVQTSLGTGKVYDSGCPSGTIDIYTNW